MSGLTETGTSAFPSSLRLIKHQVSQHTTVKLGSVTQVLSILPSNLSILGNHPTDGDGQVFVM